MQTQADSVQQQLHAAEGKTTHEKSIADVRRFCIVWSIGVVRGVGYAAGMDIVRW